MPIVTYRRAIRKLDAVAARWGPIPCIVGARGDDRGLCNQIAAAFVRERYGYDHPAYSGFHRAPALRGIASAIILACGHGWIQVQRRLERDHNGSHPPRSSVSQAGHFLASDLDAIWLRLGDATFSSHEGGEMPRAMQRF